MPSAHQITLWSRVSRSHQSLRRSGRHLSKNDWHHPGDEKVRDEEKERGTKIQRITHGSCYTALYQIFQTLFNSEPLISCVTSVQARNQQSNIQYLMSSGCLIYVLF